MGDRRLVFGDVAWCPTCKGAKKVKRGEKRVDCVVCGGTGIVPNEGPIAVNRKVLR